MAKLRTWISTIFDDDLQKWIGLILAVITCSAIFGFVYEFCFYRINDGMFVKRGSGFGPWINIYAIGGFLILLTTYPLRKRPTLVCLTSGLVCGLLQLVSGWAILELFHRRYWDYNVEIWNWGNLGGFICFRSVAFFAVSGLLLLYVILPILQKINNKVGTCKFLIISAVITCIMLLDMFYNSVLCHLFNTPNAIQIYTKLGWPTNYPTY